MERIKNIKYPDFILTSDFHLREDAPVCRIDNFWETQWKKVDFVSELQKKYNCPVLHAGDLFHHWKPSPYLISMTAKHLPSMFHTVYGQHDLPQHSLELKHKSGIHALSSTLDITRFQVLQEASWGQIPEKGSFDVWFDDGSSKEILVWHNFTYIGEEPFPGATGKAHAMLEKYKDFSLILTGDNHQSFTTKGLSGNLLVNPGSLMRQSANQMNFQPKVYLWFAEDNTVEAIDIPIETGVISREHIEVKQEHDKRMDAYVSRMSDSWELTVDFDENLERFFHTNRVRQQVKDIIYKNKEL